MWVELMLDINNLDGEMDDLKSICSNAVSVKAYHLESTGQESKSSPCRKIGLISSIKTHYPFEPGWGMYYTHTRTFNIIPQYPS
jgi:hypothetical protein